jgi:hypothetical protein
MPDSKPTPTKVHEPIWAVTRDLRTGRDTWSHAVITSRGGRDPRRITVDWSGRKWQAEEFNDGSIYTASSDPPQFWRDLAAGKAYQRDYRQRLRAFTRLAFGRLGHEGASPEALAMLNLRPPFTRADVVAAFRAKALKAHPDQGGDSDFMRALTMARDSALAEAEDDRV